MICPNCGRRNSAGATFCSRCRQRLPLVNKIDTSRRRAAIVEPRGGGGSGAVVLAVALLAGFLFIGGAAAIYLSNPPGPADPTHIAFASDSPTLPPFVQPTATPSPSPTFILLPSESPSFTAQPTFTLVPTITPAGPTPPPVTTPVVARFTCTQQGTSLTIKCQENSTGNVTGWQWNFGDNTTSTERNPPPHAYASYGNKTVTLIVTGPNGATSFKQKEIDLQPPPTPSPSPSPSPTSEVTPAQPSTTPAPSGSVTAEAIATPSPDPTGTPAS